MIAFTSSVRAFYFQELMKRGTGQKSARSTTVRLSFLTKSRLKSIANFLLCRLAVGTSTDATVIVLLCALSITLPALEVSTRPYRDVEVTRWSAAKIKWAKDNA
jgi:uncharacterized membrane protein YhaH (DUF805 family)